MQENTFYDSPYILQKEGSLPKEEKPKPVLKPVPEVPVDESSTFKPWAHAPLVNDMPTGAHKMRVDARTEEYKARAPKREAKRKMQEQEDAALVADLPDDVEDLTMPHIMSMYKRGIQGEWVFDRQRANNYLVQMNATDNLGRKLNYVSPEIQKALMTTFREDEPPLTRDRVVQNLINTGDGVEAITMGAIPAGDLVMLADAAYRRDKVTGGIAGASLALPGVVGIAAKRGAIRELARKAATKGMQKLEGGITDQGLRQRVAEGIQERTGKIDERVDPGNPEAINSPETIGREELNSVSHVEARTPDAHKLTEKMKWFDLWESESHATLKAYYEAKLDAIKSVLANDTFSLAKRSQDEIDLLVRNGMDQNQALLKTYEDGNLYVVEPKDSVPYQIFKEDLEGLGDRDAWRKMEILENDFRKNFNAMEGAKKEITEMKVERESFESFRDDMATLEQVERPAVHGQPPTVAPSGNMSPTEARRATRGKPGAKTDAQIAEMQDRVNQYIRHTNDSVLQVSPPIDGRSMVAHLLAEGHYADHPALESIATKLANNPMLDDIVVFNGQPATYKGNRTQGEYWQGSSLRDGPMSDAQNDAIGLDPSIGIINMQSRVAQGLYPKTLIHELTHAITTGALIRGRSLAASIKRSPDLLHLSPTDKMAHRLHLDIEDLMFQVESNHIKLHGKTARDKFPLTVFSARNDPLFRSTGDNFAYGNTNPLEFVAEAFSNGEFRKILKETLITTPAGKLSLYDKFVTILANILKMDTVEVDALFATIDSVQRYGATRSAILKAAK
tara:strand:- start:2900 stop:5269 length:2370 start_codon:yes stop_codon:yes gene_type:complete